jgi:hypothetical protein
VAERQLSVGIERAVVRDEDVPVVARLEVPDIVPASRKVERAIALLDTLDLLAVDANPDVRPVARPDPELTRRVVLVALGRVDLAVGGAVALPVLRVVSSEDRRGPLAKQADDHCARRRE